MAYASEKQIRYCGVLASQLGIGDEWDLIGEANGWSRSKAQKKADMASCSAAIEWAEERIETRERRASLPVGSIDGVSCRLPSGWVQPASDVLDLLRAHGDIDWAALDADYAARKAAGEATPLGSAVRAAVERRGGVSLSDAERALVDALSALTPERRALVLAEVR